MKKVKVSTYQSNVLKVNAKLKQVSKSLGFCRAVLINNSDEIGLNPLFVDLLNKSKQPENYKVLKTLVRTSKAGNYSPFFILQTLNKHSEKLQIAFADNAKKGKKAA